MTVCKKSIVSALPVLLVCLLVATGPVMAQKLRVGEHQPVHVTAAQLDPSTSSVTIQSSGASFIKLHFSNVTLEPGSRIVVSSPDGRQQSVITAADVDNGGAWAHSIDGESVVVRIDGTVPRSAFTVDRLGHGTHAIAESAESVWGTDNSLDRQCFPGTYKYNAANSVGRMLFADDGGGMYLCTGSLISDRNHFLTNNHCVNSQSEVDSLEVRFNYEYTTCGGSTLKTYQTFGSSANNLVATNSGLDFSLLTLAGNPAATYGYLALNGENLVRGDALYIAQHPGGRPKVIHARHTGTAGEDCVVTFADWTEPGSSAGSAIQHTCDTEGGSSGSPMLNDNNQIVALHHTGYAGSPSVCSANGGPGPPCNGAIEMENIYPMISAFLPATQGGSRSGATGWVYYRVKDTWRYNSGASDRLWIEMQGTTDTLWVDVKARPALGDLLNEAAASNHVLGIYWTSTSTWSNARLQYY